MGNGSRNSRPLAHTTNYLRFRAAKALVTHFFPEDVSKVDTHRFGSSARPQTQWFPDRLRSSAAIRSRVIDIARLRCIPLRIRYADAQRD